MTTAAIHSIESKVKEMVGKTYMINGNCFKVLNYQFKDGQVLIGTDKRIMSIELSNANTAFDLFLPTDPEETENSHVVQFDMKSLSGSGEIKDILMENIRNIKKDAGYIPQATAVNESVKTLLDFAKAEIQMYDLMYKFNYAQKK